MNAGAARFYNDKTTIMSDPFDIDSERPSRIAEQRSTDSVSLAFLFYLVTLAAIITACLNLIIGNKLATWPVVWTAGFVCAILGGILGTIFAYRQSRNVPGTSLGGILGAIVGIAAGLISLVEPSRFVSLMNIAFGGSMVLILSMLVMARFQNDPNV